MLPLPDPPPVGTTRHLICVSCEDRFAVAVALPRQGQRSREWRYLADHAPVVQLRYHPDVSQRVADPWQSATPQGEEEPPPAAPPAHYPVTCPRCGADNRNWMQLRADASPSWRRFYRRFPLLARTLLLLGMGLLLLPFVLRSYNFTLWEIGAVLLFAGFTPLALGMENSRKWTALRENRALRRLQTHTAPLKQTIFLRGLLLLLITSFVLPVVLFDGFPAAFSIIKLMLLNEQEQTTALHRTADQTAIGIEAYTADAAGVLWRSGRAYIPPADPFIPLSPQFITLVQNGMIVDAQRDAAAIVGRLEAHSTAQMKEIDFARATAVARIDQEISRRLHDLTRFDAARIKFMGVLSGTTFVNGLLTLVVSLSALSAFVDQIDEHLPAPLYHSVARMTRVVVWETKQALELSGSMQEIKWQLVGRNDQGGITLKGVQPPPAGLEGRRAAAACRFTIESDRFGRIIQAQRTELPAPAAGAAADLDDLFRPQGRVERPSVAVRVTPRPFG